MRGMGGNHKRPAKLPITSMIYPRLRLSRLEAARGHLIPEIDAATKSACKTTRDKAVGENMVAITIQIMRTWRTFIEVHADRSS